MLSSNYRVGQLNAGKVYTDPVCPYYSVPYAECFVRERNVHVLSYF